MKARNSIIFIVLFMSSSFTYAQINPSDSIILRNQLLNWYEASPCTSGIYVGTCYPTILNWINGPSDQWCFTFLNSTGRVRLLGSSSGYNCFAPGSTILPTIGNLDSLKQIIIGASSSNYNSNLTGTIPVEICNCSVLEEFELQHTSVYGPIPNCINNMYNLKKFQYNKDLQPNTLNGLLPNMSSLNHLERFLLIGTYVRGNVPGYFGYLDSLRAFTFVQNPLFGGILSDSICHSQTLTSFTIEKCPLFYGKLPDSLGYIPTLSGVVINETNFSDTIPYSLCNPIGQLDLTIKNSEFTGVSVVHPGSSVRIFSLTGNKIQFGSFEENLASLGSANQFNYYFWDIHPQDSMWAPLDTTVGLGWNITFDSRVTGQYNMYYWYKDSVYLGWNTTGLWEVNNISMADAGQYNCRIRNYYITPIADLVLDRHHIRLNVDSTLVSSTSSNENYFRVYPIPSNASITIKLSNIHDEHYQITLLTLQGQPLITKTTKDSETTLDISHLPLGVYCIKVQGNGVYRTERVVKGE